MIRMQEGLNELSEELDSDRMAFWEEERERRDAERAKKAAEDPRQGKDDKTLLSLAAMEALRRIKRLTNAVQEEQSLHLFIRFARAIAALPTRTHLLSTSSSILFCRHKPLLKRSHTLEQLVQRYKAQAEAAAEEAKEAGRQAAFWQAEYEKLRQCNVDYQLLVEDRAKRRMDVLRTRKYYKVLIRQGYEEFPDKLLSDKLEFWEKERVRRDKAKAINAAKDPRPVKETKDRLSLADIQAQPEAHRDLLTRIYWAEDGQISAFAAGRQDRHDRNHFGAGLEVVEMLEEPSPLQQEDIEFIELFFEELFELPLDTPKDDPRWQSSQLAMVKNTRRRQHEILKRRFWAEEGKTSRFALGRQDRHGRSHFAAGLEGKEMLEEDGLLDFDDETFVRMFFAELFELPLKTPPDDPGWRTAVISDGSKAWDTF